MKTPIYDFVKGYNSKSSARFHMPGHKGRGPFGFEGLDITEISGADVLYSPTGIIQESENNVSQLFSTAHTFYSTEGSSLAIKAMLAIVCKAKKSKERPLIFAGRNAHKTFIYAAALLDFDVEWLCSENEEHLTCCIISKDELDVKLSQSKILPDAVYITSPDYLGNIADIEGLAKVCNSFSIPLIVDNAHGAYLAFLEQSRHPIALGAAMCTDSAHKTLPALTGAAYLHISKNANPEYISYARESLSLFASTSPSYLILQSLDLCNLCIAAEYKKKLQDTVVKVEKIKEQFSSLGYDISHSEPLKIVIDARRKSYTGVLLSEFLSENGIEAEYCDTDFLVFMVSCSNTDEEFLRLCNVLSEYAKNNAKVKEKRKSPKIKIGKRAISIREAIFSASEKANVENSVGRICQDPTVSCPPAVPIAVSGEYITEENVSAFKYYGIKEISVVK